MFPVGQRIAVLAPFFKIMMDGTPGVRVDNPAEVGTSQPGLPGPQTALEVCLPGTLTATRGSWLITAGHAVEEEATTRSQCSARSCKGSRARYMCAAALLTC